MSEIPEETLIPVIHFILREGPVHIEGKDGARLKVPERLREKFHQLAGAVSADEEVKVVRLDTLITTREAAEILGVSRSTVVAWIEDDLLTSVRYSESGHRKLILADVLLWKKLHTQSRRLTW
ncbi:excisionase family DNA-binding protein [Corynebacterium nasicanis]|uniref:Excisionase family DNA-binding protein n=1 Tax=Corynebacterium nasicanis TaxID=1448267 RepID=A0ABW1Q9M0_9CORY